MGAGMTARPKGNGTARGGGLARRLLSGFAPALVSLGLFALAGCGFFVSPTSGGGGTTSTNLAYVINATTGTVSGFALGTGTVTALASSPFTLGFTPLAAVVARNNSFLYVAGAGTLNAYAIASDGSLSQLACTGCTVVASVAALDVSPDGQWLFGLDQVSSTIDLWQIDSTTGGLSTATPAGYSITGATVVQKRIHVAPTGTLVVASLGTAGDVVFSFNTTTGAFGSTYTLLPTGSTQTSDNEAVFDTTAARLYVARSGTGAGVGVYTISGTTPTAVSGSPFAAGSSPAAVALDSTSAYVYVANRGDGTISGFSIGTTGALTSLGGSPYPSGSGVGVLALDSTGGNLLATASGGTPDLTVYTFDALTAGKLNAAATAATGTDPAGAAGIALTH